MPKTSPMRTSVGAPRSAVRLFLTSAAISAVPVVLLGLVLAGNYRAQATDRGLAQGRSEAVLVARTTVQPVLAGSPLDRGLSPEERAGLARVVDRAVRGGDILRLRVRGLEGRVVYSDDGSGFDQTPEAEALRAAHSAVITRLTRLNGDSNDTGPKGVTAVETYQPLVAGTPARPVGVLEMYLPYAPISQDVTAGLHALYRDLAVGLLLLYIALFAISVRMSRGLRRQVALNAFMAEHDALTNLPNRALFHRRTEIAVTRARRRKRSVAIALVDLDRFKEVNDTLGHHNGDHFLVGLAERLAAHARPQDTVARLGGDEFGIILSDASEAEEVLRGLRDIIETEVEVNGLPLSVEASIGFVIAPDDGTDVHTLLQRADVAMYVAKAEHSGIARYDKAKDHYDAGKLELIAELRHAIDDGQLLLHYQPKTALARGTIDAVEALVRWQHPVHGLLYPDEFLPLAEQTDLIHRLSEWVLTTALTDLKGFGPTASDLAVAVNVSARDLGRADFATKVATVLARTGVPPQRLIVEITETALLVDPARAVTLLQELDRCGVRVSLDDFGRGQTSLSYLSALPLHELKIDQSFVGDMIENSAHAAIVRSVVELGHNLALRVVGEGVETPEVLTMLREAGCDEAQGFLLGRPMPADQLRRWMATAAPGPVTESDLEAVLADASARSPNI
ncbi:MAG TPA: bifunctional diguanylate cyclase/phosphodiesterase [Acidimicrobiia bacterium]|nr:bifunctional diguanylate cyclase/phosphodiesterase [Acidimicrobiia bacterium]